MSDTFQITCKYCDDHPLINIYKPSPDAKSSVTNLDGSVHKHNKTTAATTASLSSQPSQRETGTITFKNNEELAKYTYAARQQGIEKSHQENMDAYERLRRSIDNLAERIDRAVDLLMERKE